MLEPCASRVISFDCEIAPLLLREVHAIIVNRQFMEYFNCDLLVNCHGVVLFNIYLVDVV